MGKSGDATVEDRSVDVFLPEGSKEIPLKMGKSGDATVEDGTVDVILPEEIGSSFSTREIIAKVKETGFQLLHKISQ